MGPAQALGSREAGPVELARKKRERAPETRWGLVAWIQPLMDCCPFLLGDSHVTMTMGPMMMAPFKMSVFPHVHPAPSLCCTSSDLSQPDDQRRGELGLCVMLHRRQPPAAALQPKAQQIDLE